jgi:hypothetical protein
MKFLIQGIPHCSLSCITYLYVFFPVSLFSVTFVSTLHQVSYSSLFPILFHFHIYLCSFSCLNSLSRSSQQYPSCFLFLTVPQHVSYFLSCLTLLYHFLSIISIMFLIPRCSLSCITLFFLSHFSLSNYSL